MTGRGLSADYVAVDPTCRYRGHMHSHCDCPRWRRWWFKDRSRPIPPGVSGTIVMPKVHLPDGYEPASAAVTTPRSDVAVIDRTYEQGYEDGESNQLADWQVALMDLLPDDVECRPSAVAAYIERLQGATSDRESS